MLARILEERPRTTGLDRAERGGHPAAAVPAAHRRPDVPEDVSIVALCPDQIAEQTSPQLSSVNMPAAELGTRAVELLMRRMADGGAGRGRADPADAAGPRQHRPRGRRRVGRDRG